HRCGRRGECDGCLAVHFRGGVAGGDRNGRAPGSAHAGAHPSWPRALVPRSRRERRRRVGRLARVAGAMTTTPIVALDVGTRAAALELVDTLGPVCQFYKVGSE